MDSRRRRRPTIHCRTLEGFRTSRDGLRRAKLACAHAARAAGRVGRACASGPQVHKYIPVRFSALLASSPACRPVAKGHPDPCPVFCSRQATRARSRSPADGKEADRFLDYHARFPARPSVAPVAGAGAGSGSRIRFRVRDRPSDPVPASGHRLRGQSAGRS